MKIYTGTGDHGYTSLFSGERVPKCHSRLQAYGDLDELSSFLGLLIARLPGEGARTAEQLKSIQSDLLNMGAWLATTPDSSSACVLPELGDAPRQALEEAIDTMQGQLQPLPASSSPVAMKRRGWLMWPEPSVAGPNAMWWPWLEPWTKATGHPRSNTS